MQTETQLDPILFLVLVHHFDTRLGRPRTGIDFGFQCVNDGRAGDRRCRLATSRCRFLQGPLFGQFQFGRFAFGQRPDQIGYVRMLFRLVVIVSRSEIAIGQHGLLPRLHLLRLVLLVSFFQQDERQFARIEAERRLFPVVCQFFGVFLFCRCLCRKGDVCFYILLIAHNIDRIGQRCLVPDC